MEDSIIISSRTDVAKMFKLPLPNLRFNDISTRDSVQSGSEVVDSENISLSLNYYYFSCIIQLLKVLSNIQNYKMQFL